MQSVRPPEARSVCVCAKLGHKEFELQLWRIGGQSSIYSWGKLIENPEKKLPSSWLSKRPTYWVSKRIERSKRHIVYARINSVVPNKNNFWTLSRIQYLVTTNWNCNRLQQHAWQPMQVKDSQFTMQIWRGDCVLEIASGMQII